MKRETVNKTAWNPSQSDRVCSEHFMNGKATVEHPDPLFKLGYEVRLVSTGLLTGCFELWVVGIVAVMLLLLIIVKKVKECLRKQMVKLMPRVTESNTYIAQDLTFSEDGAYVVV